MLSRLEAMWAELWDSSLKDHRMVGDLASSYLGYLDNNRADLIRSLSDHGIFTQEVPPALLEYVGWVTIGINLVKGFRLWLGSPEFTRATSLGTVYLLHSRGDWGRESFVPLWAMLRFSPDPRVGEVSATEFARTFHALKQELGREDSRPLLAMAYVLGVAEEKYPTDPPMCTRSAANIIRLGRERAYENMIREAIDVRDPAGDSSRESLVRWLQSESRMRERLGTEAAHG